MQVKSFYTLRTRTEIINSTKVIAIKVINEMTPKIILQLKFDGCKGIRYITYWYTVPQSVYVKIECLCKFISCRPSSGRVTRMG